MNIANDNSLFQKEVELMKLGLIGMVNSINLLCQDNEGSNALAAEFYKAGGGDILTELAKVSLDTRTHCLLQAVDLGVL
jgi:hypothetical protein